MFVNSGFFSLEIPGAECRREFLRNFTVPYRVGFSRDSSVASVKSIVTDLDKRFEALLLRQVDVCFLGDLGQTYWGTLLVTQCI